jgi:FPC/CPF motif-containing protein YcgG
MTASLEQRVHDSFRDFIGDARYPCLAARGTVRSGDYRLHVYGALGSMTASDALADDLGAFAREAQARRNADPLPPQRAQNARRGPRLTAFVAVFTGRTPASERAFERRLWIELQRLHDRDTAPGWDPTVSADPDDPRFSFSFGGTALFVIGLHPASSRLARRFGWPALVFNPHAQFERLRREGRFEPLRERIRVRDLALQGSINPNLADFGERSEAQQYSGRDTTDGAWRCPFHQRKR